MTEVQITFFLPVSLKKWMKRDLLRKELCVKLNTQMSYKHFFQVFSHHEFLDVIIFHFLMRVKEEKYSSLMK